MGLVRASLLAITLGTLGLACGGADEPVDTTPASHHKGGVEADVGGEVGVGGDGAKADVNGEVKAGEVGAKANAGAGVKADDDSVNAGAGGSVDGTTDRDKDDNSKQQPLPQGDPNQPNPEQPQQPPQPEQPETGTTP
jgi:hypothetical protein